MQGYQGKKILLLGAGAVGQVYAYHLAAAGAEIGFKVRPKYVEETSAGFDLYELGITHAPRGPAKLLPTHVLTTDEEVAAIDWDQVWLCVPSTSLQGDWFEGFAKAIGDATLVVFGHGPADHAFVEAHIPSSQIVNGMIGYIAYQGPLEDEKVGGEGMLYWLPPGSPSLFDGEDDARVSQVLGMLDAGGCNVKRASGIKHKSAFPTAVLMPFLVALELNDWNFARVKKSDALSQASDATREAAEGIARDIDASAPAPIKLQRPWMLKMLLGVGPCITPLPLETYLAYHFTKVGAQTRRNIDLYIELCERHDLPHASLDALANALRERDRQEAS